MLGFACEAMPSEYPYPQRKKDDCSMRQAGRKGELTAWQLQSTAEEKLQFPGMLLEFSTRFQWAGLVVHHLIKIKTFPRIKKITPRIWYIRAYKYYFKIVYDMQPVTRSFWITLKETTELCFVFLYIYTYCCLNGWDTGVPVCGYCVCLKIKAYPSCVSWFLLCIRVA